MRDATEWTGCTTDRGPSIPVPNLIAEYTPWRNTLQSRLLSTMRLREVLASNLKRLRLEADLSQEELAHRADIDRTYVSSLERGRYAATVDMIERLATELQVKPTDLLADPPAGS